MAWFTRDLTNGALTYSGRYSDANIEGPYSAVVSPDGENIYLAVYVPAEELGAVAWFKRD